MEYLPQRKKIALIAVIGLILGSGRVLILCEEQVAWESLREVRIRSCTPALYTVDNLATSASLASLGFVCLP